MDDNIVIVLVGTLTYLLSFFVLKEKIRYIYFLGFIADIISFVLYYIGVSNLYILTLYMSVNLLLYNYIFNLNKTKLILYLSIILFFTSLIFLIYDLYRNVLLFMMLSKLILLCILFFTIIDIDKRGPIYRNISIVLIIYNLSTLILMGGADIYMSLKFNGVPLYIILNTTMLIGMNLSSAYIGWKYQKAI